MNKAVLLVCASFANPLGRLFPDADGTPGGTCFFMDAVSLDRAYACLPDFDANTTEADFFSVRAALFQNEFADACNGLLQEFIASEQQTLILASQNNANFIASWRLLCAEHGLALRIAHIRDFSLLRADAPETVLGEFLTAVSVLRQWGNDVAHFDCGNDISPPAETANLWRLLLGDREAYAYGVATPAEHGAGEDFACLPAECKRLIRLFDGVPMGGRLSGLTPELLAGFAFACAKDSALHLYCVSCASKEHAERHIQKMLSKFSAMEHYLSTTMYRHNEVLQFLGFLAAEIQTRPSNAAGALRSLEVQLKLFDAYLRTSGKKSPSHLRSAENPTRQFRWASAQLFGIKDSAATQSLAVVKPDPGSAPRAKRQKHEQGKIQVRQYSGLRYGAADHVRRLPAWRFGTILLDTPHSFSGYLRMPFALLKQYCAYLREEKQRGGEPLPILADFADADEGRKLCGTLTYQIGKTFIANITSPAGWFRMPRVLRETLREHQDSLFAK